MIQHCLWRLPYLRESMIITFYDLNLKNQSAPSNHTFSFIHFTMAKYHLSLFMFSLYCIIWVNKQGYVSGTVLSTLYKHIRSSQRFVASTAVIPVSRWGHDRTEGRRKLCPRPGRRGHSPARPVFSAARRGCLPVPLVCIYHDLLNSNLYSYILPYSEEP